MIRATSATTAALAQVHGPSEITQAAAARIAFAIARIPYHIHFAPIAASPAIDLAMEPADAAAIRANAATALPDAEAAAAAIVPNREPSATIREPTDAAADPAREARPERADPAREAIPAAADPAEASREPIVAAAAPARDATRPSHVAAVLAPDAMAGPARFLPLATASAYNWKRARPFPAAVARPASAVFAPAKTPGMPRTTDTSFEPDDTIRPSGPRSSFAAAPKANVCVTTDCTGPGS